MNRQPRKNRANTGRSGRGGMTKGPGPQTVVSNFDGIYSSPRFTYVLAAITGCVVQVQVKNGGTYEGVFRTASPKADFVLEMAHKLEETSHRDLSPSVPSRDRIIDKLILKSQDIVSLNTFDVDLDYAAKEGTFATDSMISSKVNGQVTERDLTPWVGEVQTEESSLENEASNGWDVNEMLRTNAEKFNVTSTFDEDMGQYTTKLEKKDTKEYKDREESAQKLANEIESTPAYKQRLQKEVEDGTEEDKFSAVQRPGYDMNNRSNTPPMHGGGGGGQGGQRYIPPAMRNRDMTHNPRVSPSPQDVRVTGYGSPHGPPRGGSHGSPHDPRGPYTGRRSMPPGVRPQSMPREPHSVSENVHTNLNGGVERGDRKPPEVGAPPPPSVYQDRRKLSDVVRGAPPDPKPLSQPTQSAANSTNISNNPTVPATTPHPDQPPQLPLTSPPQQDSSVANPVDKKPITHGQTKSRNDINEDLKKFHSTFILPESGEKGREVEKDAAKDNLDCKPNPDTSSPSSVAMETTATTTKETCTSTTPTPTSNPDENQKPDDLPKKSTLNPNAKEFKFNPQAKPFAPKVSVPKTPTPPRPQQPSPVVMQPQATVMQVPHSMSYTGQPVISNMQASYVMAPHHSQMPHMVGPGGVQQVQQKAAYQQKRAPMMPQQRPQPSHADLSQGGHIMPASAAAGQPIMAPMHYSQAQFVHYPTQHTQAMMGQHVMQPPVHYQHMPQYQQKTMYRIQGALPGSPHPQAQHTYQMSPQDVQPSATHVLMSPQGPTIPQPMPHPQAQHQHQAHQQQHPQPQPHMHHGHVQQPHTPPLQGQQQGQTQQQTQMAGQQQLQQHVHQAPSPVHQVPHSGQPTQNTHIPQQPSHQIIYQNPHQMAPQPLAQSPQGMHAQPQPTPSQAQAQPHQMQQVPVVSHPPNPHITTVTPVHPHPYPHTHQQAPPMQQQQVMVIPQAHPHGSQAAATAAAHAGATAGVVVSNAPAAMSAPYLQVDGKVMVLTEGNAYYSAAPPRMNSPGPAAHQQPVHQTYQQGN